MQAHTTVQGRGESQHCAEIPELLRLQYFYGQLLGSADFQDEQNYFREKLKLHNRCLHGEGIVCGMRVLPVRSDPPCEPSSDKERGDLEQDIERLETEIRELTVNWARVPMPADDAGLKGEIIRRESEVEGKRRRLDELCKPSAREVPQSMVIVECGVALDCNGNEIIVRRPVLIDPMKCLPASERREIMDNPGKPQTLYVSICFCEAPVEPVRPVYADPCQPAAGCRYAKLRDAFRITVSTHKPLAPHRCEPCCTPCAEPCLLLARIIEFMPGHPIDPKLIDNRVRRLVGVYDYTTITGINWVHGGIYSDDEAAQLLSRKGYSGTGLEIRFSREVRTDTLVDGIIDLWVIEGEGGRAGEIYSVKPEIIQSTSKTTDRLRFRQGSDDRFHNMDLVRIRLRADFILDECCRAVDGNHIGGRVQQINNPRVGGGQDQDRSLYRDRRNCPELWRSGNGQEGGAFESWFHIRIDESRRD